jgi:nuclear pore complex protein Nup133
MFPKLIVTGLFDKSSAVTPMSPEEISGACTDELDHRFTGLDDSIKERIMKDYQKEDDQFIVYAEKCRLNKWYVSALDQAKQDFAEAIAEETEDGKNMIEARNELENIEATIAQKEMGKAEGLLRAKPRYKPKVRANGGAGSFRTSIKQY